MDKVQEPSVNNLKAQDIWRINITSPVSYIVVCDGEISHITFFFFLSFFFSECHLGSAAASCLWEPMLSISSNLCGENETI